jgi:hypothetical protein
MVKATGQARPEKGKGWRGRHKNTVTPRKGRDKPTDRQWRAGAQQMETGLDIDMAAR